MGIAAYNRGSKAISDLIDADQRPVEFDMMDMLNGLTKYYDAGTPFMPINFVPANGGFWAQCPVTGFGFWYPTLHEAVKRWRVTITGFTNGIWLGEPLPGRGNGVY